MARDAPLDYACSMRALAVFVILIGMSVASADTPADKKLVTKTSLLGDHLTATLPADMKIAPRRASIMAAESSGEDETRGMLDDGKARFVMMAYETYSLAGPDVKAAVEADFKRGGYTGTLEPLALPKPLVGFAHTPATVGKTDEANLTYAAWIASGDGSVQFVAFYVNPDGAAQGASWSALGKKIATTIGPGKRTLAPKAGDKTLEDLAITVADGWSVSAQPGPDFTVFHLRKLAVLGKDAPTCGVYLGHHPSLQHTQQESKAKTTTTSGKLLGAKVDWTTWTDGGRSSTEALAKHPNGHDMVHVFCSAPTEPELADLRKIAETLRKK
jgi:hypothetical protein